MSIFKEPFNPIISKQLEVRQNLFSKKPLDTSDYVYLNSKSSWVQLRSSVNINGNDSLAKQNILKNGNLINNSLYTNKIDNNEFTFGLRPVPGISNISINNRGAYGSLKQANIKFECWDIEQLNILEKLYMRPGYTLLLEWGWLPYIDNNGKLKSELNYDKEFFNRKNISIIDYYKELYKISNKSNGNYDFMFGYIMNYSWKLRSDGGYNCSVDLISLGEIIESFKINYSGAEVLSNNVNELLLGNMIYEYNPAFELGSNSFMGGTPLILKNNQPKLTYNNELRKEYLRNILLGLISETYLYCRKNINNIDSDYIKSIPYNNKGKKGNIDFIHSKIDLDISTSIFDVFDNEDIKNNNPGGNKIGGSILDNDNNIYITLESLIELFNNFIIPENNGNKIFSLSLKDKNDNYLKCLYNPLQISVDPRVCIIKNEKFTQIIDNISINDYSSDIEILDDNIDDKYKQIIWEFISIYDDDEHLNYGSKNKIILDKLENYLLGSSNINKELNILSNFYLKTKSYTNPSNLYNLLSNFGESQQYNDLLNKLKFDENLLKNDLENRISNLKNNNLSTNVIQAQQNILNNNYINLCNSLSKSYFFSNDQYDLGNHSNIYVNLKLLYTLANDENLMIKDNSGKMSIKLIDYLKNILLYIQNSIGNVNNFEILIDDSVGYIIDLNYLSEKSPQPFVFEIGNYKSLVTDVNLESQIFSDQSSIIAISAQSEAGKLGLENSTMVAYNNGVSDRMIERKDAPLSNDNNIQNFIENITDLSELFESYKNENELNVDKISQYKNSLTNLINFITGYYKTSNKYKSILPTKLSLTIDGISGIIIGNIFNINKRLIPNSYKGNKNEIDLQYIVTGLRQDIINNKWNTIIEGNPFIPDDGYINLTQNQKDINININLKYEYDINKNEIINKFELNTTQNSDIKNIINDINNKTNKRNTVSNNVIDSKNYPNIDIKYALNSLLYVLSNDGMLKDINFNITSAYRGPDHPLSLINPNSPHLKGKAIDFSIISKEPNKYHDIILNIIKKNFSINLINGKKYHYDIIINGKKFQLLNEYLEPTFSTSGGHYHLQGPY